IREIQLLLTAGFNITSANWLYLVFPVIGIFLTSVFVRRVVRDDISHGITRILYAISSKQSRLKKHNCWSSVIASAITIGFGGSVGAEAPIVLTGSAIGSTLGQIFHVDNKRLMLLVGCGAAGAIAGIFKAPIAGLVFTLEVLMVDLTMASLLPILTASVTATCFTYLFVGTDSLFSFHLDDVWKVERVPACILLGLFCGLVSWYFIRMMTACENVFARMKDRPYAKLLLGGLMLSSLIFFFPSLYGEGYSALNILLNGKTEADWNMILNNSMFYGHGDMLIFYIALVLLTKVFATSATNGGGGCGGTFAPSLFIGGFAGFLFSRLWNMNQIGVYIPEKNFALLGMGGVMAGVMHAPLTGIFLIAEITGGYQLLIPLIIVAVSSVITISLFEPHSIYAMRLAKEGKLITHHTDHSVLTLMNLNSVIERDYISVSPEMPLGKLVHVISQSQNNFIPVLDEAGTLLGEIDITEIRHVIFRTELYQKFQVSQVMTQGMETLGMNDPMEEAMRKFEETNADFLPVVDVKNRLVGYIPRTRIYSMYRNMVADMSAE
ncbi:MAG: chloride channel protein, partial [Prevotella sp.]|nr:chloride channel protein [Prevotella sp.]